MAARRQTRVEGLPEPLAASWTLTLEESSAGVAINAGRPLPSGGRLELRIEGFAAPEVRAEDDQLVVRAGPDELRLTIRTEDASHGDEAAEASVELLQALTGGTALKARRRRSATTDRTRARCRETTPRR